MKKIYFCLPAILTGVLQLSAQDIITKCNGEEIAAKVAEIGDTQIKYRKYENAQGPLYTLPASEVFLIRFEDGTREVVTPLDAPAVSPATAAETTGTESSTTAPAAANENYAQINRSGNISGPVCSAGVIAEYMFDKMSPHGAGAGISYDMYMFEEDFDLNCMNIDLYYVYRPRGRWNCFAGFKFGIPVKSEASGADLKTVTNTAVGIEMGAGWATRHFDLGAAIFMNFNSTLDISESNRMVGVKLRIAYRF